MHLTDLITPTTPAGAALFLKWQGYHVFSIPQREIWRCGSMATSQAAPQEAPPSVRFYGVGGKRKHASETFVDCALRESMEEIGAVVAQVESAEQTYLLRSDGTLQAIDLTDQEIRPRLILEKRQHSGYGSMTGSTAAYYLVAFNASLAAQPKPSNEIAAILYLQDQHLALLKSQTDVTIAELVRSGAQIDYQTALVLADSTLVIPHGTANFLMK